MSSSRVRRLLVSLYPAQWRVRYGDELLAHLDDEYGERAIGPLACADLVAGGLTERARTLVDVAPAGPSSDESRGLRLVLWGWWCCVIGGIGFAKLTEHFTSAPYVGHGVPSGRTVAGVAYGAVVVCAIAAGVLVSTIAAPALLVAARRGASSDRRRLWTSLVVAAVLSVAAVGYLASMFPWAHSLSVAQRNGADTAYGVGATGLALLVALVLAAWTRLGSVALRPLRSSGGAVSVDAAARVAACCVALLSLAVGAWWAAVAADAPSFFGSVASNGPATGAPWPLLLVSQLLVALGAVLATVGAFGRRAREHGQLLEAR